MIDFKNLVISDIIYITNKKTCFQNTRFKNSFKKIYLKICGCREINISKREKNLLLLTLPLSSFDYLSKIKKLEKVNTSLTNLNELKIQYCASRTNI